LLYRLPVPRAVLPLVRSPARHRFSARSLSWPAIAPLWGPASGPRQVRSLASPRAEYRTPGCVGPGPALEPATRIGMAARRSRG